MQNTRLRNLLSCVFFYILRNLKHMIKFKNLNDLKINKTEI